MSGDLDGQGFGPACPLQLPGSCSARDAVTATWKLGDAPPFCQAKRPGKSSLSWDHCDCCGLSRPNRTPLSSKTYRKRTFLVSHTGIDTAGRILATTEKYVLFFADPFLPASVQFRPVNNCSPHRRPPSSFCPLLQGPAVTEICSFWSWASCFSKRLSRCCLSWMTSLGLELVLLWFDSPFVHLLEADRMKRFVTKLFYHRATPKGVFPHTLLGVGALLQWRMSFPEARHAFRS